MSARGEVDERTAAIEDAFVNHWQNFGTWSDATLRESYGVLWFETPIKALPYNMVLRTWIEEEDADAVVGRVAARFRARDVPFIWVVRPSDMPTDLGSRLARQGLDLVESVTGMDLELRDWNPEVEFDDGSIRVADYDEPVMREYVEMIRTYWSVPDSERHYLEKLNADLAGDRSPGFRLVAYDDGKAIGKMFMNTSELPRVSVYGVAVKPEARGKGTATKLMNYALARAKADGAGRCVLHSSEMAHSLYRRMGFVDRCELQAYATGPIFGTHQH